MKKKEERVQGTPEKEARCLPDCLRPNHVTNTSFVSETGFKSFDKGVTFGQKIILISY
jgi:hypothetical protein